MERPIPSIAELHARYKKGDVRPSEVVDLYAQVIEAREKELNAFISLTLEQAREQALQLEKNATGPTSPVWGVPLAVKDNIAVKGVPLTCGSRILLGYTPPYTATVMERLLRAGVLLLGKTNMDEFAMGSSGEHSYFGPTRNPLDPARVPGGSSSGSAAAVASGEALAALGSDTGGSIRQPAAFTGIVGFKPSYGRVSRWGLVAFASSLDQIGPMTLTVDDAIRLYAIMGGMDPHDATTVDQPVHSYEELRWDGRRPSLRVGVVRTFLEEEGLDPSVRQVMARVMTRLEQEGLTLVDVDLPHQRYAIPTYYLVATSEASSNLSRFDGGRYGYRAKTYEDLEDMYARTRGEGFGEEVKRRIMLGTFALSSGYAEDFYGKALRVRRLIREDFVQAFRQVDVLLTPVTPYPPFRLGEKVDDPLSLYLADLFTVSVNLAGLPALSQPGGRTPEGLPVGIQWIAPYLEEKTLFQMASFWESLDKEEIHGAS